MHVCAMASARATIGGPLRNDLLSRTSARAAAFQSLTTVAQAEAAQTKTPAKVVTLISRRTTTVFSNWIRTMVKPLAMANGRQSAMVIHGRSPQQDSRRYGLAI